MRRFLKWLGIGLLALVVVAAAALAFLWSRVPRDDLDALAVGDLTVDLEAQGMYTAGPLRIVVDSVGVTILGGERDLWSNDPGRAFLSAGIGEVQFEEHRGYFWAATDRDAQLADQHVTGVTASDEAVVLTGTLDGDARQVRFTMTISPDLPELVMNDQTGDSTLLKATIRARISAELVTPADAGAPSSLALVSGRSEGTGVHGFGEQFAPFDLSDRLIPILVREQGVGRGEQPITTLADLTNHGAGATDAFTYAAWPTFVTDDLRGLTLDPDIAESHAFGLADTTTATNVALESWAPRIEAIAFAGDSPKELLAARAAGTERANLPDWATSGAILGLQGGADEVRAELAAVRAAGTPVAAVWLQDWTGQRTTSFGERLWWTWQRDEARYPDWKELVAELKAEGIRTTTYVNTWLVDAAPKGDPSIRNLWAEARDAGYLVTREDGSPYLMDQGGFEASLVDLTNPAARDWFATVIAEEVLADGVVGFMADFGEGAPFDGVYHEGDGALVHNRWPALWAQTVRQACDEAGQPECLTWFRSGALGQERDAALFWNGDQLVTYSGDDGLASALLGTFSAGVSGWPITHSDVGGYTSVNAVVKDYVRSPELLARWAEYEAFGVVMRTHEGNRPAKNRQVFDPDQTAAFARMARLHEALADYRQQVIEEATATGIPALRHPWVMFPGTKAADVDTQVMLGDSLLVAPVLAEGVDRVDVTLPPGRWVHVLTGETFDGDNTVSVAAPVGTPAAFVLEGDPTGDEILAAIQATGLTAG